ncbi:hypothetical protein BO668P1_00028 [Bacteroides phage BO668P1]|nr:hypothetical protein BO668P1_00028 [Bacteroides phage BO668P1]
MNIYIPIADVTLTDGQTYDGQLPVWATRPLMARVTTGTNEPVNIIVREGGAIRKTISLPYQQYGVDVDLSFAAPLIRRADRNESEGTPWFPQQLIEFWSTDIATRIIIPVFHCDETYWDTLGVDGALPQPPKPRIPGQTLDIYFPYSIHPSDALSVEVEPVTGAPSNVIFPTTYVLGNTIDIKYIKKLTIKNVWGSGLDQVINYEDRLMSDVVYDTGLQCALRARWNMRNGQWFWDAFKDYFWSNKFTPIRGRGGVTEQAELTINLEYGEEYYNVYQELLVSSNVVFELNLPGINQYQSKRFRAEVSGDTGARWSNSTKTYRQQVRFRTTELQDNYMFPIAPDQPPTPAIQFSAQVNPWLNNSASYMEGMWNNIYSNTAWEVQSTPTWMSVGEMVTLTADDFEQGGLAGEAGTPYEDMKFASNSYIRSKNPVPVYGKPVFIKAFVPGYNVIMYAFDADMKLIAGNNLVSGADQTKTVNIPGAVYAIFRIQKAPLSDIAPSDATTAQIGVSVNRFNGNAGTSYFTATVAANPGEARTGNIVLKSLAGSTTYNITVTQAKASIAFNPEPTIVSAGANPSILLRQMNSNTSWRCVEYPTWAVPINLTGDAGYAINCNFNLQANTGAPRSANITYRSTVNPSVQNSFSVTQAGVTGNISTSPSTFNVDYLTHPVTVNVTSVGSWVVAQRDTWIGRSISTGPNGTTAVTLTIDDNTSNNARTGTITFYNDLTGNIAVVTVNQGGAPTSIGLAPLRISGPKAGTGSIVPAVAASENGWTMGSAPSWVSVTPALGGPGQTAIGVKYDTPNPGAARTGELRIKNTVTNEIAICLITQEG